MEISQEDYEDIKTFLTKYHSLSDNDFLIENEEKRGWKYLTPVVTRTAFRNDKEEL